MSGAAALFREGLAHHQVGRIGEARAAYEAALEADPVCFDALHMLGVACVQAGEAERGAALLARAVEVDPGAVAAHSNRAMALNALGRFEAAVESADRALALRPDDAAALLNRGNALLALRRPAEALAAYEAAVAATPGAADAHYNRANALRDLGRLTEAVAAYDAALALHPGYLEALGNKGAVLARLGRLDQALGACEAAVRADPGSVDAQRNRAAVLARLHRLEEAVAGYDAALALRPDDVEALNGKAGALNLLHRPPAALAAADRALALAPAHAEALNNRGIALYDLRRHREALAAYDQALTARPEFAEAHLNRSLARLMTGDLLGGFEEYSWRWAIPNGWAERPAFACPAWAGESLAGKRVLVFSEQGFGDTLQFVRFVPRLAALAEHVTLLAEPALAALLRPAFAGVEVTGRLTDTAGFDANIAMMCLPRLFATTLETIPRQVPYLAADPAKVAVWAERLAPFDGRRVGLVWAGASRKHDPAAAAIDRRRSMRLSQLAPLARFPGATFFSLQLGEPAAETPPEGLRMVDFTAHLHDFAETAALVANLDLVITVDTALAHLAGALGRPVWILSRFDGCWRWLEGRDDSPWYPTARLFHQRTPGDWAEVVARVAAALKDVAA
ncbi:MAG TPA: tetratricopeptide repeat protein [Caulobacteraceae bacterium]|nr:tetratricopeptide repeat protein [Caulobacteraceae bacterium]